MNIITQRTFRYIVQQGRLNITDHKGRKYTFGQLTDKNRLQVSLRLKTKSIEMQLVTNPNMAFGEGYMNGDICIEEGDVYQFMKLMFCNLERREPPRFARPYNALRNWTRSIRQHNSRSIAKKRISHHYDVDYAIYKLFLDKDLNYSCAYFPEDNSSLEEAQLAKQQLIASKMKIQNGQTILDIGCGWGSMALFLAKNYDVHVVGVTLSQEQLKVAQKRASSMELKGSVEFQLRDYRDVGEKFDRIVSIGMFEHVGVGFYEMFFECFNKCLKPDGVGLLHSIGRSLGPGNTNSFISKYIFPGGYIPALSEVMPWVERAGLVMTNAEILRLHYAKTLHEWRSRFHKHRDKVLGLKSEEFFRMWDFYLAAAESSFEHNGYMVFQLQLCKSQYTLGITRSDMYDELNLNAVNNVDSSYSNGPVSNPNIC